MDDTTDSDFLTFTKKVDETFSAMAESMKLSEHRLDRMDRMIERLEETTSMLRKIMTGNGGRGCQEDRRALIDFNRGLKKILWVAATVGTAAAVTGILSLAKHLLASP